MNELHIKAVLAGLFFGIWPILMNRSGLTGNISSAVFAFGVLIIVAPFAAYDFYTLKINAIWAFAVGACVFGGLGMLNFTGLLSKATPQTVGSLFVMTLVMQIAIPALYQVINNGGLTASKALGFVAAVLAAFLLA